MQVYTHAQEISSLVHFLWYFLPGFLMSFAMGTWVLPYCIQLARARNILDIPNTSLKTQKAPVPYLGGLAILICVYATLALIMPASHQGTLWCIGTLLLALLGLADDLQPLSPSIKFIGQAIIALCFIKGGLFAKQLFLSSVVSSWLMYGVVASSWAWIVVVTNAFNVVDVMDGLCAVVSIGVCANLVAAAWSTGSYDILWVLGPLAGALSIFLRYNRQPAQIYLGDSGSLLIGGTLSIVPFMMSWQRSGVYFGMLAGVAAFAIPLSEVAGLMISRWFAGIPWYKGSRHHFCHYLLDNGWTVSHILKLVGTYQLLYTFLGVLFLTQKASLTIYILLLIVVQATWIAIIYGKYVIFALLPLKMIQKQQKI